MALIIFSGAVRWTMRGFSQSSVIALHERRMQWAGAVAGDDTDRHLQIRMTAQLRPHP
jgi:hypothetical protein